MLLKEWELIMTDKIDIDELKHRLKKFAQDRDWEQFHSPKNLCMALGVEASELMEIFQWLTLEQSKRESLNEETMLHIEEEIADIILYSLRISDILGINISEALNSKIEKNAEKYPIEKSKGHFTKYNKL